MIYFIRYGKRLLWMIISILISLILINTLYYYNIISTNTYKVLEIITLIINIFISTYLLGKKTTKLGYLEGIKFSSIIISLFLIITLRQNVI